MAEELLVHIVGDASKLKSELDKAGKGITGFATKAAKAGKGMAIAGGLITAAFGLTVKAAIGFNKEIANIATLIPGSTERVNELKSAIRTMAVEVGKDTTDLAQGAYQVISAFGDTADTVAILGIAAKAATAGVATTTDSINLLSAVTKGYGDTSKEAVQKASDLAFQTVTLGQTTFPELATSIGKVIPLTSELGVSQEELFAVMATGTGVTGKAAEVSTQLRGIMQSLMSPTADMTKLLAEKEYTSGKAMLADLGLAGALDVIKNAAEASNAPLQKYISSIEGQTLALALTGTQADTYISKLASMRDSVGLTDVAFKEQTEGVNAAGFAFERAKIQITTLAQEIGDMLLPMLTPLINKVTEILGKIRDWADTHKPLIETLVKVAAGVGALMLVLGPLLIILPSLVTGFVTLKAAIIAIGVVGSGPIGLFIIAIAGVVLGLKAWQEHSEKVREENLKLKASLLTPEEIVDRIKAINKKLADLRFQLELTGESMFLAGDLIKGQIKALEAELKVLIETLGTTGTGIKQVDEFAQSFADKMLKLAVATKNVVKTTKDIPPELEEILKGSALLSAQMSLLKTEYENSNKTLEDTQEYYKGMIELLEEYIKQLKIEIEKEGESTPTWFAKNEELLKAVGLYEEVKEAIEELNKVQDLQLTGLELTRAKLELLELRYAEIEKNAGYYGEKLKLLREEHELLVGSLDDVIEEYGEWSEEHYELLAAIEACKNEVKKWWKEIDKGAETIDEFAQAFEDKMLRIKVAVEGFKPPDVGPWEEFFNRLKDKAKTTTEILQDTIFQWLEDFVGAIENAFKSLLTMAETNAKIKEEMAEAEADYLEEMADLQEDYQQMVSDGIKELAQEKEDYYDDMAALELSYNRKVKDGIKDLRRENEDYDIDMRRLTLKRNEAAMRGDDERVAYYELMMEDTTLAHERAVEDITERQEELTEDHEIEVNQMKEDHKDAMDKIKEKQKEQAEDAKEKLKEVREKHKEEMDKMEDQLVTPKTVWETFWTSLKNYAISALTSIIGSWAWKVIIAFLTWIGILKKGGGVGYKLGGEIEKQALALGGMIEGFQVGGLGTDTVPAMLTPGEYVVAKPMTDFIRRFRAIPDGLARAIAKGAPTPVPAFAGGGLVGNPNITSSNFGETNINVYISGNKISDNVDIRKLATTVSDEIVRRLNQRRRF